MTKELTETQVLIKRTGLTHDMLALKLDVGVDALRSYSCDRRNMPEKKMKLLRLIIKKIENI